MMAGQKLLPTRFYELSRWLKDRGTQRQLKTPAGRTRYWNEIASQCADRALIELLESTLHLPGDVIECGVYRGTSLLQIAHSIKTNGSSKRIYGLDSFEGFPEDSVTNADVSSGRWLSKLQNKFRFAGDTPAHLNKIAQTFDLNVELVRGFFSATLPRFQNHTFSFIHLDVDIYQSYKECLEALYDRLAPGGVIVFDEWDCSEWPGATLAIKEFFADLPEKVETCSLRKQAANFVRKLPAQSAKRAA